jgi:hypothetical protein
MARPTRIAVDLTLLLDLAANDKVAWQGLEAARKAFTPAEFLVSPATLEALMHAVVSTTYGMETRSLAKEALSRLMRQWKFSAPEMDVADLDVCAENARQLIATGLLGGHAWNSAHTVAEAACLECSLLLCHDPELLEINFAGLRKFLEKFDRESLWITTPGEVLRQCP